MTLTYNQIISILNSFSIKYYDKPSSTGWLKINCPSLHHKDNDPSAGINMNNSVISCFGCGYKSNLLKVIQQKLNLSYKETIEHLETSHLLNNLKFTQSKRIYPQKKEMVDKVNFEGIVIPLDPTKHFYFTQRGVTKEFCIKYGIQHSITYPYVDYIIIPIKDTSKGIELYEARKFMEFEYLQKYFKTTTISYYRMKNQFKNEINKDENDYIVEYLCRKKVLYPPKTRISETLFDIDNLHFNNPIYLVEGIMSLCKIKQIFPNSTACFGSQISQSQFEYLKKFKEVIVIPDNDLAGRNMVKKIHKNLEGKNTFVLPILVEDTDINYINKLKESSKLSTNDYLVKQDLFKND